MTAAGRFPAIRRNKVSEQLTIKTSGQLSNELAAVNLVSKLMAITPGTGRVTQPLELRAGMLARGGM